MFIKYNTRIDIEYVFAHSNFLINSGLVNDQEIHTDYGYVDDVDSPGHVDDGDEPKSKKLKKSNKSKKTKKYKK